MKSYAFSASQTINRQLIIRSYEDEGHIYSHLNIKFVETGWVNLYTSPKELKLIFSNKLFNIGEVYKWLGSNWKRFPNYVNPKQLVSREKRHLNFNHIWINGYRWYSVVFESYASIYDKLTVPC